MQRSRELFMIVMLETAKEAINAAQIAATEGVDALMMGQVDLSLELNITVQVVH